MKQPLLKATQLFVATSLLLIAHACTKHPLSSTEDVAAITATSNAKINNSITDLTTVNPFNRRVGAPVDGRTGDQWIANYKNKYGTNKSYTLNNAEIQAIVNQSTCVGISLTYAIDAGNNNHILLMGVDGNGKTMKRLNVSTMQGNISWATAQQWIANDLGPINSHFLGGNTFYRLNENPCKTIRVDYAIDEKGKQQLLLSNPCVLNLAKQYEDNSLPCPTICPKP